MTKTKSALKKSVARRWVKALLSGKYKQAQGCLRDWYAQGILNGHCCLGVLCDISKQGKWHGEAYRTSKTERCAGGNVSALEQWSGLSQGEAEDLAELNDSGKSFRYIASRICKMAGIEMPATKPTPKRAAKTAKGVKK